MLWVGLITFLQDIFMSWETSVSVKVMLDSCQIVRLCCCQAVSLSRCTAWDALWWCIANLVISVGLLICWHKAMSLDNLLALRRLSKTLKNDCWRYRWKYMKCVWVVMRSEIVSFTGPGVLTFECLVRFAVASTLGESSLLRTCDMTIYWRMSPFCLCLSLHCCMVSLTVWRGVSIIVIGWIMYVKKCTFLAKGFIFHA